MACMCAEIVCFEDLVKESAPPISSLEDLCSASRNGSLVQDVERCLLSHCSPADTLDTIRKLSKVCEWPIRSRKSSLVALFAIQVPALVCLGLRLYGRVKQAARFSVDDYLVMLLTPVFVAFLIVGQYAAAIGFGVDIWTVPNNAIVQAIEAFYVDEMLYLAILTLIKLSFLFLYLRIFAPQAPPSTFEARRYRKHYRNFRVAMFVLAGFVLVPSLVFLFLDAFQCRPVNTAWRRWTSTSLLEDEPFTCLNIRLLAYVAASFGIAQDAAILIAPWPLLFLLRKSLAWPTSSLSAPLSSSRPSSAATAAMVTALAMFSLGVFVLATSCIRLHFLVHFDTSSLNPTWDNTDSLIWSGLEVSVSVIVMSLPTVRVMAQNAWRRCQERRRIRREQEDWW